MSTASDAVSRNCMLLIKVIYRLYEEATAAAPAPPGGAGSAIGGGGPLELKLQSLEKCLVSFNEHSMQPQAVALVANVLDLLTFLLSFLVRIRTSLYLYLCSYV